MHPQILDSRPTSHGARNHWLPHLVLVICILTNGLRAQERGDRSEKVVAAKINRFGIRLYEDLARERSGNILISPLGLETLMALLLVGARGETAAQLSEATGLTHDTGNADPAFAHLIRQLGERRLSSNASLVFANALWVEEGLEINSRFTEIVRSAYGAPVQSLNFIRSPENALRQVNEWVAHATQEKIRELVQRHDVSEQTRFLLTNVVFFEASWERPFLAEETKPEPFHSNPETTIETPMMHRRGEMRYAVWEDVQVIELTYKDNSFSFMALLPGRSERMPALERALSANGLTPISSAFPPIALDVDLKLPKFSMDIPLHLEVALKRLGLSALFSDQADLSGIATANRAVSSVLTRSYVRIDERGTVAASASAAIEGRSKPTDVHLNRPFIFLVRESNSGVILFIGRFVNPVP